MKPTRFPPALMILTGEEVYGELPGWGQRYTNGKERPTGRQPAGPMKNTRSICTEACLTA